MCFFVSQLHVDSVFQDMETFNVAAQNFVSEAFTRVGWNISIGWAFVKFHLNKLRLNLGYSEVESSYTTIQMIFLQEWEGGKKWILLLSFIHPKNITRIWWIVTTYPTFQIRKIWLIIWWAAPTLGTDLKGVIWKDFYIMEMCIYFIRPRFTKITGSKSSAMFFSAQGCVLRTVDRIHPQVTCFLRFFSWIFAWSFQKNRSHWRRMNTFDSLKMVNGHGIGLYLDQPQDLWLAFLTSHLCHPIAHLCERCVCVHGCSFLKWLDVAQVFSMIPISSRPIAIQVLSRLCASQPGAFGQWAMGSNHQETHKLEAEVCSFVFCFFFVSFQKNEICELLLVQFTKVQLFCWFSRGRNLVGLEFWLPSLAFQKGEG